MGKAEKYLSQRATLLELCARAGALRDQALLGIWAVGKVRDCNNAQQLNLKAPGPGNKGGRPIPTLESNRSYPFDKCLKRMLGFFR